MKKDIIWLILMAVGVALVWPDYTNSQLPLVWKWIGMAMLGIAIIWKIIELSRK